MCVHWAWIFLEKENQSVRTIDIMGGDGKKPDFPLPEDCYSGVLSMVNGPCEVHVYGDPRLSEDELLLAVDHYLL